ncbi:MAG TPA: histidine--tRNA ligase [Gaiellales bacterium]|jgi:histidyl-tRNA synthetase
MSERFQPPRGTRDWSGDDAAVRRRAIDLARSVFEPAGYGEVVTPGFEDTALFARSSGETSDVVSKEMYTFEDRSGRSLTLRPESTAAVMRAYLNSMTRRPQPVKLWYCQNHFRYNAVQRGRAREHYQFGVEAIGAEDAAVDAEVIALQHRWYELCGVPALRLELNSIGDAACRPAYVQMLVEFIDNHAAELCDECLERRHTNPLRVLDCKNRACQAVLANAPRITDHLCEPCREHFAEVRRHLDAREVEYELVPALVRGLDYYTRTTWEWMGGDLASSISGGGRYDGLSEQIGGGPAPGVGFGAGLERLLEVTRPEPDASGGMVLFAVIAEQARPRLFALMDEARAAGVAADAAYGSRRLKRMLELAGRRGAQRVVIVGDDEWEREHATLRDMTSGEQRTVALDALVRELTGEL